ncbi:unnamed protein product [Ilex paraguariensis]|uniref:Glycosyltransferase n=1 Tax=Ilex paraguariensis TaxID=185542 RepID=A0ABC8ULD0_9AQUA
MADKTFHIVMYPWFAMGHLIAFVHISNKLAERGHRISFFIPTKTQSKLQHFNLHPDLITFIPVTVPAVDGLPLGAETTADVPYPLQSFLMTAMDLTQLNFEASLVKLKPHFVFFDFTHWMPPLTCRLGIKCVHFCIISPATVGYLLSPAREFTGKQLTEADFMEPPAGFPPSSIKLHKQEARGITGATLKEYGKGISFRERLMIGFTDADAIGFKTCKEMEGPYCDYLENQFNKPVILAGPALPEPPISTLEERWAKWMEQFKSKTVIFCAFGSECVLQKEQFQELVLGFELIGLPFFAALKPPIGIETVESALPKGFQERVQGRGVVHGGWVQQQLLLGHPSVGCFVTHCGSGSLTEGMVNECQLVLVPHVGDQIINARVMGGDLKVGVEVERGEEDGLFTKDSVCKAIRSVMEVDSEVGNEVKANHAKWREFLLSEGLESSYIDGFVQKLGGLLE